MRHHILWSLTALFLWTIPAISQAQGITGRWQGTVTQYGPGSQHSNYAAGMALDGKVGTIDYPGLKCGGTLTFIESRGSAYAYRERITYGKDHCMDYGLVTVTPTDGALQWEWTVDIEAKATLDPVP